MIILKNDTGDFIYFDVVTQYSRSFGSQVSAHPVDGSGVVSDHVTKSNPRIQLVGSISGADFNSGKPNNLPAEQRNFIGIDQIVVPADIAQEISIRSENSPLDFAPDVVGQFFTDSLPQVNGISEGRDSLYAETILYNVLKSFYDNKVKLTLYEFDEGIVSSDPIEDVFITSLNINETVSSGDSFSFDITLEKVTFSNLLEEDIPEDVQEDFRKKSEEEESLGGDNGTDVTGTPRESDSGTFAFQTAAGG